MTIDYHSLVAAALVVLSFFFILFCSFGGGAVYRDHGRRKDAFFIYLFATMAVAAAYIAGAMVQ